MSFAALPQVAHIMISHFLTTRTLCTANLLCQWAHELYGKQMARLGLRYTGTASDQEASTTLHELLSKQQRPQQVHIMDGRALGPLIRTITSLTSGSLPLAGIRHLQSLTLTACCDLHSEARERLLLTITGDPTQPAPLPKLEELNLKSISRAQELGVLVRFLGAGRGLRLKKLDLWFDEAAIDHTGVSGSVWWMRS